MKRKLLYLALVAIIVAAGLTLGHLVATTLAGRPVLPAKPAKYGAIVRLVTKGSTFCTGTVINPNTILTAAHCIMVEGPFGPIGYRRDIDIRPSNNKDLGVQARVTAVRHQMDQAILKGDFQKFNTRRVITDVKELTILRSKSTLTACGYPLGGNFYCNTMFYKEPEAFMWKVSGVLIPGMSGGCVIDEDGSVVATNVAVMGAYSLISPTYNLELDILKGE